MKCLLMLSNQKTAKNAKKRSKTGKNRQKWPKNGQFFKKRPNLRFIPISISF